MTPDTSGHMWRSPLAFYDPDEFCWRTSQGTFGSELMKSSLTLPAWGTWDGSALYELPTPELRTDEPESSSLLPTPRTSDTNGVGSHGTGGPDLWTAVSLLPTPRATDGEKGGPNQRGSSGDLMLPSAVHRLPLLGTPRAQHGEDRNANIYARDLSQPQNLENQLARLPGAPTAPPSTAGSASPDDQLPGQLSLDDSASD